MIRRSVGNIHWLRIAKKRFGMEDCYEVMQYRERKQRKLCLCR